ncbi:hypothetical protein J4221_06715 [Candidatus Pacearchaeota archaeon]|nr:hypothetical protein [Candidatus Pacearchaeota archaeon]
MSLEDNPLLMLPENYENMLQLFYDAGGKKLIEDFAKELEKKYNMRFRSISWNEKQGLTNISYSLSTGLDLIKKRFAPHNMDLNSDFAKPAVELVLKYIEEINRINL